MEEYKERRELAWQGMFYSIQRIDLLIISICGAGIYISLEIIKFSVENQIDDLSAIKISGLFFIFGIILNFISQLYGYKANEQDYLMCEAQIQAGKSLSKKEKSEIADADKKSEKFSTITKRFNSASMLAMFLGLLTLIYYLITTF